MHNGVVSPLVNPRVMAGAGFFDCRASIWPFGLRSSSRFGPSKVADSLAVDALDLLEDRLDSPLHRLADRLDAAQRDEAHRVLVRHFARATEGARRIALIGLPDSGLVALGEGLAAALALRFVAFDAAMAAAGVGAGVGAGEVFQRFSHAGVQRLQRRVLEQSLAGAEGVVLAVGVAVAASPRTWAAVLRSCRTIWLRVSSETIIRREQARLGATRRRDLRAVLAAQTAMLGRADAILDIEGRGEAEILAALIGLAAG